MRRNDAKRGIILGKGRDERVEGGETKERIQLWNEKKGRDGNKG